MVRASRSWWCCSAIVVLVGVTRERPGVREDNRTNTHSASPGHESRGRKARVYPVDRAPLPESEIGECRERLTTTKTAAAAQTTRTTTQQREAMLS